MTYVLLRTDKANDQLYEIVNYIAEDSGSIDIALAYLQRIEEAVMALAEYPRAGHIPRYSILKKQGYLVLTIERHLVFYKVDDERKVIMIDTIFDGRQDYLNLL